MPKTQSLMTQCSKTSKFKGHHWKSPLVNFRRVVQVCSTFIFRFSSLCSVASAGGGKPRACGQSAGEECRSFCITHAQKDRYVLYWCAQSENTYGCSNTVSEWMGRDWPRRWARVRKTSLWSWKVLWDHAGLYRGARSSDYPSPCPMKVIIGDHFVVF